MIFLITGANRGIGRYLSEMFVKEGNEVFGTYNNKIPEELKGCRYQSVNVTDETQVIKWLTSLEFTSYDKIILINCAGVNNNAMIHKSDTDKWEHVINTNLLGSYFLIKAIIPIMIKANYGRIINLSSVVPKIGISGTSAYSASKAALWGLSKSVSKEIAKYNITINTINLGYFDIGMINEVPEKFLKEIIESIPIGTLGDPISIYQTITFLIDCYYITGSEINLNGGLF